MIAVDLSQDPRRDWSVIFRKIHGVIGVDLSQDPRCDWSVIFRKIHCEF